MKKILASFLTLLFLSVSAFAGTINSYDKYGSKSGSYRINGSTTTNVGIANNDVNATYNRLEVNKVALEQKEEKPKELYENSNLYILTKIKMS